EDVAQRPVHEGDGRGVEMASRESPLPHLIQQARRWGGHRRESRRVRTGVGKGPAWRGGVIHSRQGSSPWVSGHPDRLKSIPIASPKQEENRRNGLGQLTAARGAGPMPGDPVRRTGAPGYADRRGGIG